jgi:hypothetical protein
VRNPSPFALRKPGLTSILDGHLSQLAVQEADPDLEVLPVALWTVVVIVVGIVQGSRRMMFVQALEELAPGNLAREVIRLTGVTFAGGDADESTLPIASGDGLAEECWHPTIGTVLPEGCVAHAGSGEVERKLAIRRVFDGEHVGWDLGDLARVKLGTLALCVYNEISETYLFFNRLLVGLCATSLGGLTSDVEELGRASGLAGAEDEALGRFRSLRVRWKLEGR